MTLLNYCQLLAVTLIVYLWLVISTSLLNTSRTVVLLNCLSREGYGLTQQVTEPTHNKGHTLDPVLTNALNIVSVVVNDVAL